jgi:hypothetical protein
MTGPRLFLHIGHPKTGTTSIQTFLLENRAALRREGVLVPHAGVVEGAHHGLTANYYSVRRCPDRAAANLEALRREVEAAQCPTVVISSEALIQENPERFAAFRDAGFAVVVIYYIRRQDLAVESVYAQRVRSYNQMEIRPIQDMLRHLTPHYRKHLDRYAQTFGRDHVRVRPFEKAAFQGGALLPDFLTLIGVDPARYPAAERKRNTAFKRDYLEFKRRCNRLPLLENEHQDLGDELDALSAADTTPQPRHALSHADRVQLLDSCAVENTGIARDFMGRHDGTLFTEPPPDDDAGFHPIGSLPDAVQHALFDRLSPTMQDLLEFLDRTIRQRLPGESFMPEIPDDPEARRLVIVHRERDKLRRRIAILERQDSERQAIPPRPGGLLSRVRRLFLNPEP